jgi:hypothetical protein
MKPESGSKGFALPALLCLVLAGSCSTAPAPDYGKYVPFTRDLIAGNSLSEDAIKQLQFFVSTDILLRRELTPGDARIARGKLIVDNGKSVDEVEVPKFAPGVADAVEFNTNDVDHIVVSFEKGAPGIEFIARVEKPRDSFGLMFHAETHAVSFGDLSYRPLNDSLHAILLVDRESMGNLQSKRRVLKGLLLPGAPK